MKISMSIFLFFLIATSGLAQIAIDRQVIGSTGNFSTDGTNTLSSTVGEPNVSTKTDGNLILTEGFQQPTRIHLEELDLYVYTGITPNGDGVNDKWEIDGIERYPGNSVIIFNRWQEEVWTGENYNNTSVVFKGESNSGAELVSATYYFVVKVPDMKTEKGWVQVTR